MFSFLKKKSRNEETEELKAFASGKVIPIEEVKDDVFSQRVLGDGIAIEPVNTMITASCSGEISVIMEDSKHAVGMKLDNGAEILLHEGIDTVNMNGEGFEVFVKVGQRVSAGDKLLKFNPELINQRGYQITCILIITNSDEHPVKEHITGIDAIQNETTILKF